MRLTTKGRFAVTAMVDLGLQQKQGPVTLASIAERHQISLSYLEQLFGKLRRKNLVASTRGPGGGYTVAIDNRLISIADIINAVDEALDATNCGGTGKCQEVGMPCMTHKLWTGLNDKMYEYLNGISLEDVVSENKYRLSKKNTNSSVKNTKRHHSKTSRTEKTVSKSMPKWYEVA